MYYYTTNNIYTVPIKNRHVDSIKVVWLQVYGILKKHGEAPNLHILENEYDTTLKQAFKDKKDKITAGMSTPVSSQYSQTGIRTLKNHLVAGLCSCDSAFPSRYKDDIIPHVEIILNLLRSPWRNP